MTARPGRLHSKAGAITALRAHTVEPRDGCQTVISCTAVAIAGSLLRFQLQT